MYFNYLKVKPIGKLREKTSTVELITNSVFDCKSRFVNAAYLKFSTNVSRFLRLPFVCEIDDLRLSAFSDIIGPTRFLVLSQGGEPRSGV